MFMRNNIINFVQLPKRCGIVAFATINTIPLYETILETQVALMVFLPVVYPTCRLNLHQTTGTGTECRISIQAVDSGQENEQFSRH